MLNGIKDTRWNLHKPVEDRHLLGVLPKGPENDNLRSGLLVIPEQLQCETPAVSRCSSILDPRSLGQLGNMDTVPRQLPCSGCLAAVDFRESRRKPPHTSGIDSQINKPPGLGARRIGHPSDVLACVSENGLERRQAKRLRCGRVMNRQCRSKVLDPDSVAGEPRTLGSDIRSKWVRK